MRIIIFIVMLFLFASCIKPIEESKPRELKGDYLGQVYPNDSALVFAEGVISNQYNVRDATFSPDGNEFCYSLKGPTFHSIISVKRKNGKWKNPEVASFSGKYSDIEPCFSPDGNKLYFVSNRPINGTGEPKDYDIWFVEKVNSEWGTAKNVGLPINTEANEFYPSFTKEGDLYFCAKRENSIGGEDLFFSRLVNNVYQPPINLGDSVNTARDEFNSFVSPNGDYIMFTSTGWGPGFGGGDLWISFKNDVNEWTKPKNMGESVNSASFEYCPSLSPDGNYLFFTSNKGKGANYSVEKVKFEDIIEELNSTLNGSQNIYWINSNVINSLKQ